MTLFAQGQSMTQPIDSFDAKKHHPTTPEPATTGLVIVGLCLGLVLLLRARRRVA